MLEALNWLNLALWAFVVLWLSPALSRYLAGVRTARPDDALFSLFWFTALIFTGYRLRTAAGLAPIGDGAETYVTAVALRMLGTGLALGILWKKWKRQGWTP